MTDHNLMTTNCYYCKGDIVIAGACLAQVYPEAYARFAENADQVFTLCLEDSHINMAVTKIAAILGMKQVTSVKFVSVDRSPHCTQLHYIKHEIERTLPEHVPIEDYVVSEGKIIRVSDRAIDLSKSLAKLAEICG